jgi:PIN domain nuclease of toxin-antitoxin system
VIVLDTHIWIWWVNGSPQLAPDYLAYVQAEAPNGLGVSAISCWELAKLVAQGRLQLALPVDKWLTLALQPPVLLFPLSPEVAVASTQLPGGFHKDPADQINVATARVHGCPLVTVDARIRDYPHVRLAP